MLQKFIKKIDKNVALIILLYVVFLYCQVFQGSFERNRGTDSVDFSYGVSTLSSFSMYTASLLAIIIGFFRSYRYKNILSYKTVLIILSVFMVLWFIYESLYYGMTPVLRSSSCFPLIYLIFWALFFSFDSKSWDTIIISAKILGPVLLILSLQQALSFQNIYGGYIGNSPQILLLGNGFCVMMVALLGHDNKDGIITKVFYIGCILCGIATAIIYATRSWTIQCILLIIVYLIKQSHNIKIKDVIMIIISGLLIIYAYVLITNNLSDSVAFIYNRGISDSRSWQYEEIFSQFSFWELFWGQGTFGKYHSANYGNYGFIDNTSVLLWFHYGFITMLLILYLLLKAPFKVLTSKKSNGEMKTEAIIMVLWFCALNGLSVYNTIIFDLRNLFMVFALGKCLQNYGLIRKY